METEDVIYMARTTTVTCDTCGKLIEHEELALRITVDVPLACSSYVGEFDTWVCAQAWLDKLKQR